MSVPLQHTLLAMLVPKSSCVACRGRIVVSSGVFLYLVVPFRAAGEQSLSDWSGQAQDQARHIPGRTMFTMDVRCRTVR